MEVGGIPTKYSQPMCIQARVSIPTIRRSFVPGIFSLLSTILPLSLSLSLSPSLSLSLITLGRRVRSLKFKYRESFAKNNVVPVVSWAKFHGGNSWYSFVTWPPPFHRIRLWLNFPAIIGENRDGSPFSSPPLPLILSFGGREKFGV